MQKGGERLGSPAPHPLLLAQVTPGGVSWGSGTSFAHGALFYSFAQMKPAKCRGLQPAFLDSELGSSCVARLPLTSSVPGVLLPQPLGSRARACAAAACPFSLAVPFTTC